MESHILNTYHQARYRSIGHKILRSSESISSESSGTQNSPEYQNAGKPFGNGYKWRGQDWSRNQTINMTKSQDTSSDEEENIEVQELSFEDRPTETLRVDSDPVEENFLVEGADYDVIQVFAVDPNLELEVSSEDEEHEDFAVPEVKPDNREYVIPQDKFTNHIGDTSMSDVLNFNLDTPVVSNVDEYFIKEDKHKDILAVKDEPVVKDVDEYFIKEDKAKEINVDDFFVKEKPPEVQTEDKLRVGTDFSFVPENAKGVAVEGPSEHVEVPINESDLEVLPNIEDLKKFLLEDMTYSKFKNAQRSCSLPQSPMHNLCLDIDDAKTCLSFEDLNLDLSDLTFDNDKDKSGKSDDAPCTLTEEDVNSFLITTKPEPIDRPKSIDHLNDDLSHQDMEIDQTVESTVSSVAISKFEEAPPLRTSTPAPKIKFEEPPSIKTSTLAPKTSVLDFAIEKSAVKKESPDIKVEVEDFVDVESCNDPVIPVLAASNLNALLEQFEATEKLNTKSKPPVIKLEEQKVKSACLTNGMRLQDAGVQLNKTKMRQILMPSTINATVRRSPSPVHSDHDYCSSKKRYSLPNIKGGQSLLKPEVLSSNSRILNSRHRSCKNKKIVYALSSDDEGDKKNIKLKPTTRSDDSDIKIKKPSVKETVKLIPQATRKKLSPVLSAPNDYKNKTNISVIVKDACKASDTPISQNSNGSIKLTIKNKSEVILNCDDKDSQKTKIIEKGKTVSDKEIKSNKVDAQNNNKSVKHIKELVSNKVKTVEKCTNVNNAKEAPRPKEEHFYTALFSNKQDVQVPQPVQVKSEKRSFEEEISISTKPANKEDNPQKKKRLNLQEYKLRRCVSSNSSSAAVSPEAIFPDATNPFCVNNKTPETTPNQTPPNGLINMNQQNNNEAPKKIFDPIREASRKILMNTKKQKAEAMRKRDEDIVMRKIPKVENLELQPLISDAEMLKIVGMASAEPLPKAVVNEKPQIPTDYEEIVMVSIGVNTSEAEFIELERSQRIGKSQSPTDLRAMVNFKIKKSDHVLKQNVFDAMKRDRKSPVDEKKPSEMKIDKERFKDITATLKSVGKQVDTKISSNSLFASIQDVVMKKAPDKVTVKSTGDEKRSKSNSPKRKALTPIKTLIVREYDANADHGEDKVILHLEKNRSKPQLSDIVVQTVSNPEFVELPPIKMETPAQKTPTRKRNDSDMSMSSESSPSPKPTPTKTDEKKKLERQSRNTSHSVEKRSKSRDRYDKYRRTKSRSRSRRRRRSYSRSKSRSRSHGRFRRYRRSGSPYRRKRRTRSPYRRRSPSVRREYRSKRSRSRNVTRSKSPVKRKSPNKIPDRNFEKSMTPPLRKPTVSESSDSSTSSSSSSSSSSSDGSRMSRRSSPRKSCSPYKRDDYRKRYRSPNSSEDRENNTPVEERRIVFVGRLEKDITKSTLRSQFSKFGHVIEVRLHSKEDGTRYGFVTYQRARDAWSAVEAASTFPQYDVGFGGRRAFCRQSYADLDGLEAKYTESAFHGSGALPLRRENDMSFEQMLLEMKKKLIKRKGDKKDDDPKANDIASHDDEKLKCDDKSKRDVEKSKRDVVKSKPNGEESKRNGEESKRVGVESKRNGEKSKRDAEKLQRDSSVKRDDKSKRDNKKHNDVYQ